MTLEKFLAMPEEEPALEYFGGRVTQKASPKLRHSFVQGQILHLSNQRIVPAQTGVAGTELRVTIGGASRVPDVVIFRWDRIPRDQDGELLDDVTTPPDVIVEVLSPGQSQREQRDRCYWFVGQGVEAALLVHPRERWIDVIRA